LSEGDISLLLRLFCFEIR